jgi:hypothetical protein
MEDLEVHFEPDPTFWPDPSRQPEYQSDAYWLGFFAAFSVEAEQWVFDLGGHRISQSLEFRLQQRFYAHISLTDRPFLPRQGPANFGEDEPLISSQGAIINGHLGTSSHHGIHGNGATRILIENVTLNDYEVAGISLNGSSDLVLRNVHLMGSAQDIPVRATFSQARFAVFHGVRALASRPDGNAQDRQRLGLALNILQRRIDEAIHDLVDLGLAHIDPASHPEAFALFDNAEGLSEGNAYGILLHARGTATEDFSGAQPTPHRVWILNCSVSNTIAAVHETIGLAIVGSQHPDNSPAGRLVLGPAGDVVRFHFHQASLDYHGDELSEVQFALASWLNSIEEPELPSVNRERDHLFGMTSIDTGLLSWWRGGANLSRLIEEGHYRWVFGRDPMAHLNKGVIAVRIDAGSDICIDGLSVTDTENRGLLDEHAADVIPEEIATALALNDLTSLQTRTGYRGADARALTFSGTQRFQVKNLHINGVVSEHGLARAIELLNETKDGRFDGPGSAAVNLHSIRRLPKEVASRDLPRICNHTRDMAMALALGSAAQLWGSRVTFQNVSVGAFCSL